MSFITRLYKSLLLPRYALHIYNANSRISTSLLLNVGIGSSSSVNLDPKLSLENETSLPLESSNKAINESGSDTFGTLSQSLESSMRYKTRKEVRKQKNIIKRKNMGLNESDSFGNLSKNKPMWYPDMHEESKVDNDLDDDSVLVKNISKRYRCPRKYLEEMKLLVEKKKVKEALDLFIDMRRNFVTPLHAHYTFMIGACGRVGFTEMAFKLLRQMTDRSFQPTSAVLTGLFNSCGESPFAEYGLKKARQLKEKIESKNWPLNQITYHAMIKAFGKCGDLPMAFQIVDEMAKADIKISGETYNFLLMSCIGSKETGFTYAVEVLRKMKAKKCPPDRFTCNLLLRAARDCDIGSDEISCLLLQHWSSYSKRPYGFITKEALSEKRIPKLISGQIENINESIDDNKDVEYSTEQKTGVKVDQEKEEPKYEMRNCATSNKAVNNFENFLPSLLGPRPIHGPEFLELVNIKTPSDRLNLIGGMKGFLKFMLDFKIKPNIKTFTLLLDCLPSNFEEEEQLLSVLEAHQVKPDIDFCNMLIKKRNFRKETDSARKVLELTNKYALTPDIITFGVLALGCRTLQHAIDFLDEMEKFGSCPNIEIAGAMLGNACTTFNYSYIRFILKLLEERDIKPAENNLLRLEKTINIARKNIITMEQNKEKNKFGPQRDVSTEFKEFCIFYEDWLKRMKYEHQIHPWSQYRTDIYEKAKKESEIL